MSAAAWTRTARDLTGDRAEWGRHLTIEQIADRTGLEIATIRDNLARAEIVNPTVPRGAICRPVARIGMIPLWSKGQLTEYDRRVAALAVAPKGPAKLPDLSAATARERGLVSIAALADEIGCAENTLRRLSRDYGFPQPVALARRERKGVHGRQHELRERCAVLRWVLDYSLADGARDRLTLPDALLDELAEHIGADDDATAALLERARVKQRNRRAPSAEQIPA